MAINYRPLPLLRVGWGRFFDRNIWPDFRVFRIQRQPFLKPRLGVGLDRVDRAFRLADPAIDAFVRVDNEHVLALVEAVHGAHFDAVHGFAANAAIVDDVRQLSVLSADRSGELIHGVGALPKSATPSMAAPAHVDLGHAIGIAGKPHFLARQFRRLCVPKTSSIFDCVTESPNVNAR
jgi:hypothetical protein